MYVWVSVLIVRSFKKQEVHSLEQIFCIPYLRWIISLRLQFLCFFLTHLYVYICSFLRSTKLIISNTYSKIVIIFLIFHTDAFEVFPSSMIKQNESWKPQKSGSKLIVDQPVKNAIIPFELLWGFENLEECTFQKAEALMGS